MKKELCAYCGKLADADPDHVFARTLFRTPSSNRDKIKYITVPSCKKCQSKSATEEEAAIIFNVASSIRELGPAHIKGIKRSLNELHSKRYEPFLNAVEVPVSIDGYIENKVFIKLNDAKELRKLITQMSMGLVYEYITHAPVRKRYPISHTSFMTVETETELDTEHLLSTFATFHCDNIIIDEGRYNNEIKYAIVFDNLKRNVLVYFHIFDSTFFDSKTGNFCRYFATSFRSDLFSLRHYMARKNRKNR